MTSKQTQGDNRQRRQAAKKAREEGTSPSAAGVTTGASKQRRHMDASASHDERVENVRRAKLPSAAQGRPDTRPASGRRQPEGDRPEPRT